MSFLKNKWSRRFAFEAGRLPLTFMFLGLVVSIVLGAYLPIYTTNLYDAYLKGDVLEAITKFAWLILFEYLNRVVFLISTERYVQRLIQFSRSECYSLWIQNYHAKKSNDEEFTLGEILARIMSDTEAIRELLSSGAFTIFIDFGFLLSFLVSFLKLNLPAGLFFIGILIVVFTLLGFGSRYLAKVYTEIRKINSDLSRAMANITGGFIQAYYSDHHRYASTTTDKVSEDFLKKQLHANNWETTYFSIADSLFPILLCGLALIFPYTGIREMAIIAALIELIQRSLNPIKSATNKISSIQRALTGIDRIDQFILNLKEENKPNLLRFNSHLDSFAAKIFNFSYPNRDDFHLKDIQINAQAGELIALVGKSGCGKSTIFNLLACQLKPEDFEFELSFKNNEKLILNQQNSNFASYRQYVGLVSQDSHIFSATLEFNISLGLRPKEEFEVFYSKIIEELPYLKRWGVKGSDEVSPKSLSLGQKQLIMTLRACFLQKAIVLYDEIASALDSDLEEDLRKLILLIQKHSLTFIVAHRLETIMMAHKIYVIENGRVKSSGTHRELLDQSSIYQEFISELKHIH